MSKIGKYMYGIVEGKSSLSLDVSGIGRTRPHLISYKDLHAVVSDAPLKACEPNEEELLCHNGVLDFVMQQRDILPLRFGTLAVNEEDVKKLMEQGYTALKRALEKIKGAAEFDLEAFADEGALAKEVGKSSETVKAAREEMAALGRPLTQEDLIGIGQLIAGEVEKFKKKITQSVVQSLSTKGAVDGIALRPSKDNSLFNMAFLVGKERADEFESVIRTLDGQFQQLVQFRYAGPLPAYSFTELKFTLLSFDGLDEARRILGLPEKVSVQEIKSAHRRLAKTLHPDKLQGGTVQTDREFQAIHEANRLLLAYCKKYTKEGAQEVSLSKEDVQEMIILEESKE